MAPRSRLAGGGLRLASIGYRSRAPELLEFLSIALTHGTSEQHSTSRRDAHCGPQLPLPFAASPLLQRKASGTRTERGGAAAAWARLQRGQYSSSAGHHGHKPCTPKGDGAHAKEEARCTYVSIRQGSFGFSPFGACGTCRYIPSGRFLRRAGLSEESNKISAARIHRYRRCFDLYAKLLPFCRSSLLRS